MAKLQRFIPQTPDPYLLRANELGAVKFGHLNALVDAINATIYGDYLQLQGDGPMSTTLRALEDPEGNLAKIYLAIDKTAILGPLKIGAVTAGLPSAILDIESTTQGVLFPRMTIAERDAVVSPAIGLLIYNTDDLVLNQWDGTEWAEVGGGGGLGLLDKALLTSTLTSVVDKENTTSPLKLSTDLVSVASTLQISTDDTTYIDAEDSLGNNRFTVSKDTGQQVVNIDFASNPTLSEKVGAIRTYQDGAVLSDALSFEKNGQVTFTERVKVEADSTATTQSTAVIQSSTPGAGIALVTGGAAITAHIPNGEGSGGNARGSGAVDLQIRRVGTAATAVASGDYSVLLGGQRSTASGQFSFAMGNTNTASASNSMAIGGAGNTASSTSSAVLGGSNNTASTGSHATVVGGNGNTSSGGNSISGGSGNTASGSSSVSFGNSNNATGTYAVAFGWDNDANEVSTFVSGARAKSYLRGQRSHAPSRNLSVAGVGQAQMSELVAIRTDTLTTAATTVLSLDGTGTTNLIIPDGNNRSWNVKVETIAVVTGITGTADGVSVGDSLMQDDTLLFTKVGGVSSVVGVNNTNLIASTSMGTAGMSFAAGASQELAITFTAPTFTGGGSVTCRVVSKVSLVEVAW